MGGLLSPPKPDKVEPKPAPDPIEKEDAPELKVEDDSGRKKKARGTSSLIIPRQVGGTSRPSNSSGTGLTVPRRNRAGGSS